MSKPLLEKSKQSMMIAESLVKQHYYSATVNRAYYSCFQFILHILIEKLGHSHENLDEMPRTGTHSQAQYLLELTLIKKDKKDYKWFQQKLPEFKQVRVIADYYGDAQSQSIGYEAINTANAIINTLKKHY